MSAFDDWLNESFPPSLPERTWARIREILEPRRWEVDAVLRGHESASRSWKLLWSMLWLRFSAEHYQIQAILDEPAEDAPGVAALIGHE